MSTYLTTQQLTVCYSHAPLFNDLCVTISQGEKIGLIGHNGCGKSTLIKVLSGRQEATLGQVSVSQRCLLGYVEQSLPANLLQSTVLEALQERLLATDHWQAECLLADLGFAEAEYQRTVNQLSGGQQIRLLLARAVITKPDLLLLDEPSNHLDLPSMLWLESFLSQWKGSFVLVSHDDVLLDKVTNSTWIMRDSSLYYYDLPCSQAREQLAAKDCADEQRFASEQKEIERLDQSAKRLAQWGKTYDNEDLARKAKTMQRRKTRLIEQQTELSDGTPWILSLKGSALPANRLVEFSTWNVCAEQSCIPLFIAPFMQVKSGDRIAIMGANGCGKSTLLRHLYQHYQQPMIDEISLHNQCRIGYYDQSLQQVNSEASLNNALRPFTNVSDDVRKQALINAGFTYERHQQMVSELSGGERARLLFTGLSLAQYHLLMLDEPTNHLDLEGKEQLADTLLHFAGGVLLVSHDRRLIETCCTRFWVIVDNKLCEYLDVNEAYSHLDTAVKASSKPSESHDNINQPDHELVDEEALLVRLVELEQRLADDLKRKPRHQKVRNQQRWQEEIEQIVNKIL
ncbi:ATP-binding cassette domain-containing protein [Vibrio sp. CAIM 722]|uniref:ATP-binding cassette domain-containing protein n=1 Tax=Vibrio eleionomae TaxID=2653505 RepID=A0A7X4LMW4_9VIBR|nr:ABC-F family ATP-binding cassette domain-containing protein [Vibrio eleionomae]MZI94922.1 ATP-binding cassette domain-containing protein [Vibrio eleionomae]